MGNARSRSADAALCVSTSPGRKNRRNKEDGDCDATLNSVTFPSNSLATTLEPEPSPARVPNGSAHVSRFRLKFKSRASQYEFPSTSAVSSKTYNENEPLTLTKQQRRLVAEGWRSLNEKGSNTAGIWIFKRIFAQCPEVKSWFRLQNVSDKHLEDSVKFQRHAQVFSNLLEIIVTSIEEPDDSIAPLLLYYGSKHAHIEVKQEREFKPDFWTVFGKCIADLPKNWKLERGHKDACKAWDLLTQYIVRKVWEGHELERERMIQMLNERST